jgi:D-inositol-3-phosphate glycosyltransferase
MRVAVISVHTSPIDQPGTGDSGGMNVYIRAVAERLAARGVDVDVFTRDRGCAGPLVNELSDRTRVVRLKAGPCVPIPKSDLPRFLPEFLGSVLALGRSEGRGYDLVHSHYWLSGWVGRHLRRSWGVPLVSSFHTLGKVKNYSLAPGEPPEPSVRLAGEERVIHEADRILAPTPAEAAHLVGLYGAKASRIRLVPPGVDHDLFHPRDRSRAKADVGLGGCRVALFVGRLQPHKGPDVAIRTLAEAVARDPAGTRDVVLAVVGGPSGAGSSADVERLRELAAALGVGERVRFFPPQPQVRLAEFYAAADVVLVPSRSESFGLVALEAQACGSPVIASAVGGLRYVVRDGITGTVVPGHDPADYATALLALLGDPDRASRLGAAAAEESMPFSWGATASAALRVYREVTAPAPAGSMSGDGGGVDADVSEDGDDRRPVGCASGATAS